MWHNGNNGHKAGSADFRWPGMATMQTKLAQLISGDLAYGSPCSESSVFARDPLQY